MLSSFFKKPKNVTRFIGDSYLYDNRTGVIKTNVFAKKKDRESGEISVFDIDNELMRGNDEKIFKLGDKRYCKRPPHTLARADLKVEDIEKIESCSTKLFLEKKTLDKHCNIKPFPLDKIQALNVAGQLVAISKLIIRDP